MNDKKLTHTDGRIVLPEGSRPLEGGRQSDKRGILGEHHPKGEASSRCMVHCSTVVEGLSSGYDRILDPQLLGRSRRSSVLGFSGYWV